MGSYAAPSVTTQSLSFRRPEPTPNLRGWLSVVAGCVPQDGAIDELDDSRVMFGYVRCIMPDGRPKFVAIIWAGPAAAEQHKGKIQGYQRQIEDFLRPSHLKIMVSPHARPWIQPQPARLWGLTRLAVVLADSGPGQARDEDDIDEAEIMQKLAKSGGASY